MSWGAARYQQYPRGTKTNGKRSKFEDKLFQEVTAKGIDIKYEELKLPYTLECVYTPDFQLPNGIIIEAKGYFTPEDRAKMLRVQYQHPELDIRFVFQADNKIHPKSNTRYSDWCVKHGFKWAISRIPDEWLSN